MTYAKTLSDPSVKEKERKKMFVFLNKKNERDLLFYLINDFQSRGFYDVPQVLIADARSSQALAAILD